jgi:hypothetical protein
MSRTSEKTWQRVRTSMMSAALLKPVVDQFIQSRKSKTALAKIVDQMPLTAEQSELIEKIARQISDRVIELTSQAQTTIRKTNKRVWWGAGLGLGFAVAGAVTFAIVRRRMTQVEVEIEETFIVPDGTTTNNNGYRSPIDQLKNAVGRLSQRQNPDNTRTAPAQSANSLAATALEDNPLANAPFVGNARTMVYHLSDSMHLPSEDNRVYFRSQQEAEDAGYHPAVGEGE